MRVTALADVPAACLPVPSSSSYEAWALRYLPMSLTAGVKVAKVAPAMSVHVADSALSAACHCQVRLVTEPSGSVREAVNSSPTKGPSELNSTIPGSSTLVTRMVTSMNASDSKSAFPSASFWSPTETETL